MKKSIVVLLSNSVLAMCLLFASCNTSTEKDRKELAKAEEEALEKAEEANKLVPAEADQEEIAGVKQDLEKANRKLSQKQEKYYTSLREKETKLNERIGKLNEELKNSKSNSKKKMAEKQDRLMKERDELQANILEIQTPMTDSQLQTVQKEIDLLITVIDKELASE